MYISPSGETIVTIVIILTVFNCSRCWFLDLSTNTRYETDPGLNVDPLDLHLCLLFYDRYIRLVFVLHGRFLLLRRLWLLDSDFRRHLHFVIFLLFFMVPSIAESVTFLIFLRFLLILRHGFRVLVRVLFIVILITGLFLPLVGRGRLSCFLDLL